MQVNNNKYNKQENKNIKNIFFIFIMMSQLSAGSFGSQKPLKLTDMLWMPNLKKLFDKKSNLEDKQLINNITISLNDSEDEEEGIFKFYEDEIDKFKKEEKDK